MWVHLGVPIVFVLWYPVVFVMWYPNWVHLKGLLHLVWYPMVHSWGGLSALPCLLGIGPILWVVTFVVSTCLPYRSVVTILVSTCLLPCHMGMVPILRVLLSILCFPVMVDFLFSVYCPIIGMVLMVWA